MQAHRNRSCAHRALVDRPVRARYTPVGCAVCAHERIDVRKTSRPQYGGSARRAFALVRDLRERR